MTTKDLSALEARIHALELELARCQGRLDQASKIVSTLITLSRAQPAAASAPATLVAKADEIPHADFMSALASLKGGNPGRRFKSAEIVAHHHALKAMAAAAAAAVAAPAAQPAEAAVLEDVGF